MTYEYRCNNTNCKEYAVVKEIAMSISEYSEDKLPKCIECNSQTVRNYTSFGLKTFGDGYKA